MIWLFVAIGVGILLALAMLRFGMRRSILVLGGIMIAGFAALIWYAEFRNNSGTAIPESAVQLTGFAMRELATGRYQMNGRIFNKAADRPLQGFSIRVLAKDCAANGECVVIGDQGVRFDIDIPAGQARDLEHIFEFSNIRPVGKLDWGYQLRLLE